MIDRVEELLELVEEQPDEDGQEDGLALEQETGAPVVPVSGPEEDGEEDVPPPERDGGPEANSGPRAVPTGGGTGGPEWPEEMTKTDGGGAGEAPPPAWEARRLEAPVIPGGGSEAEADKGTLDRESGRDGPEQAQTERRPGVLEWHRAAQQSAAPAWRPEGTAGSGSQVWPEGAARNGGQIWQVEKFREGVPAWQGEGPRRTPETEEHHSVPQGPEEARVPGGGGRTGGADGPDGRGGDGPAAYRGRAGPGGPAGQPEVRRGNEYFLRSAEKRTVRELGAERGRGEAREAGRTPARGGVKASERFGRFAA